MSRIAFLSCHLTGTGHLVRTLALARAARKLGHEAVVMSGGRALEHLDTGGVDLVQLPPVIVQGLEFTILRMPGGELVTEAYMASRLDAIGACLDGFRPDALVTELFPLGRRVLAEEFLAAITLAREINPKAAILSSVRDIPEPKPRRLTEASARLLKNYDGMLVHGDEAFLPLSTTWPLADDVAPLIHHVGYVSDRALPQPDGPRGETVLVSVGGGVLGRRLLGVAAKASALSERPWHLLVGGADADATATAIAEEHPHPNLTIEPARPDYLHLLVKAACSVSLCGYNTAVEIASSTTPAILVPSEQASEAEQLIRARRLAEFPGISLMRADTLSAGPLAAAAEMLALGPPRSPVALKGDDGTRAIQAIEQTVRDKA